MDDQAKARLIHFIQNLQPDSATKAAEDFGVDITRLARDMMLTPTEAVLKTQEFSNALIAMNESNIRFERDQLVNDLIAEIGPPSAEEAQAIDELMAAGERITKRDAEALRLLRED